MVTTNTSNGGGAEMSVAEKVYTWTLVFMCVMLMLYLVGKLAMVFLNKSKVMAWSTCFYCLCLLWVTVRVSFWISIELRDRMTYLELYLLYWFPTTIQFANFALLVLFYIQVITGQAWRTTWRRICLPLYLVLTLSMATFTAIWACNSNSSLEAAYRYGDEYDQDMFKISAVRVQLEYSAISFFVLSFLFAFFGWKLAHVDSSKRHRLLISKPRSLAVFNSMLFLIFFTRSVRDFLTSQNWLRFSVVNPVDQFGEIPTFSYFAMFVMWDFVPTILLLALISTKAGAVGVPRHASFRGDTKLPDFGIFHVINTGYVRDTSETTRLVGSPAVEYGGAARTTPINVSDQPRWTRGGDLFTDLLRYDSDNDCNDATPTYVNSLNSESSLSATSSYDRASSYTPSTAMTTAMP
ncbi:hypothetical protein, variant 1 [Aphanomyces invadans]|uniref:THH1/TOM1/TOM3 domain-containing protein n=1 Tax=Aphanomyces invadans TaxID=157072 RepID=A0A024TUB3_9STRA|nr:hypothetical protein, variant 1 [Aphanomyces invadans]ETV97584.1 hypothetical protein, variant 1 [Aphanomyces invadans]|eukprot:XP_008873795.1 hypothetical protein, variant 1 [Aphanomyces invadans]